MTKEKQQLLSVVIPIYNESSGLKPFHNSLIKALNNLPSDYEVIYVDDGSEDDTPALILDITKGNSNVKLIRLSRNFGKEYALSAGIGRAKGQSIVTMDGDGQHPADMIAQFLQAANDGFQVVVGVRADNRHKSITKRFNSKLFYSIFNKLTGQKLLEGSTDFRLITRPVQQAFLNLNETDRITRGLIDWLGFKRQIIYFKEDNRKYGKATYDTKKLFNLAANSFVSLSPKPLYIFGSLGVFITLASFLLGLAVIIEQLILNDPLHWRFTGTAMLGILILFLVGIILMSQGILSLYISHIHNQSKGRPLYIIDYEQSVGIEK